MADALPGFANGARGDSTAHQKTAHGFLHVRRPGLLWVANAFPMADTHIIAGLEPIGEVPDLRTIHAQIFTQSLGEFRYSMRSILDKGFYETREMREDLARGSIRGVMPALYTFVVRTGHRIIDANYIKLDAGGSP